MLSLAAFVLGSATHRLGLGVGDLLAHRGGEAPPLLFSHWFGLNAPARLSALSALVVAAAAGGVGGDGGRAAMLARTADLLRPLLVLSLGALGFVGNDDWAAAVARQDWGAGAYIGRAALLPWALPLLALATGTMKYGRRDVGGDAGDRALASPLALAWWASRGGGREALQAHLLAMGALHLLQGPSWSTFLLLAAGAVAILAPLARALEQLLPDRVPVLGLESR